MFRKGKAECQGVYHRLVKRGIAAGTLLVLLVAALTTYGGHWREGAQQRLIESGEAAMARGDTSAAIEAFSGAIALKPDAMIGHLKRGEAYYHRNELEAALRDLRTAVDLDPYAPRSYESLGDVYYDLRRFDRAAERYQQGAALDDQAPRLFYKLALAHFGAAQPAEAEIALRRALALDERFAEAYYLLGLSLREMGRQKEAAAALRQAVSLDPALLAAREELASVSMRLGRADDRIAQLEALRALDGGGAREVALALAYARSGRTEYAIAALGRALERYPDYPHTRVALGRIWLDIAEARQDRVALGKALEALEAGASTARTSEALTLLGRALLRSGETRRAERLLQEASILRPVDPLAFLHLADAAGRLNRDEIARDALLDYHAITGDDPDPRRRAAFAARVAALARSTGHPSAAASWYARAIAVGTPEAALLVRCAEAQAASGDTAAAHDTLARALQRDPANAEAIALQRRLR